MNQQAHRQEATDQELALRSRRGDTDAFSLLVERYWNGVVNMVYRMCGDKDLAQESTQETFLRAWKNIHSYDTSRPLRSWLYRIAANLTLDALRRAKPVLDIDELELPDRGVDIEADAIQRQRTNAVRKAVLALPPASRQVLVLREYEGMSYQEISETLAIPLGTVMSRLNYARTQLRASLTTYMEEG